MNQSAAKSFADAQSMSNNGRAGVQIDNFNSNLYIDTLSHDSNTQSLRIPTRLNPHKNVMHRSKHLQKL